jgi:preprotein translocase subunit SecY
MSDLNKKILITLGFLLLYRLFSYITVPGVDVDVIKSIFEQNAGNMLQMANMFSGNAIAKFSIISLGIMPYITASIIMELVAATFPKIGKMKKEKDGMQQYMQIIKYATIGIAFIQSIGVSIGVYSLNPDIILVDKNFFIFMAMTTMVTGTMILVWIGEQITQKGLGNGISLIIFAGIVSGLPGAITGTLDLLKSGELNLIVTVSLVAIMLITTIIIIFVELGERKIPVSYVKQGNTETVSNFIPIKINIAGIIPPIFASAILMFPSAILGGSQNETLKYIHDLLQPASYTYNIFMFFLVIFFAYFYTSIVFNSKEIAENLQKQNSYIQGIRPGKSTEEYLNNVVSRMTLFGSVYLAIISTVPWLLVKSMGIPFYFGGTLVLIVVQVALDTMKKFQAEYNSQNMKSQLDLSRL